MCAACARPRGAFFFLSTHPPPDPGVRPAAGGRACRSPSGSPRTSCPPAFLFGPEPRPPPRRGHRSGVLFPGQGNLWGEPSVPRNRLVPSALAMLRSRSGDPPVSRRRPGKAPRSVFPKGDVPPSCPPPKGLAPLGADLPNTHIPAHPAPPPSAV